MSNVINPIPYTPPRISPETASLLNTVSSLFSSLSGQLGGKPAAFTLLPENPDFSPFALVSLKAGTEPWTAELDSVDILTLHPAFDDAENISPEQLPEDIQKAVLYSLLLPVLERLSSAAGIPVSVEGISLHPAETPPHADALTFKVLPGSPSALPPLFLRLAPVSGISQAAAALSFLPKRSDGPFRSAFPIIPVEIAFELGSMKLSREEFRSLDTDDILFPSSLGQEGSRIFLRSTREGRHIYAECELKDGNAVLMSKISTVPESTMETEELNDLTIRLSFDLGQQTKTLGELASLDTGHVFLLGMNSETPVNIRAEGRLIAQGRLVDVNGTLGVQIMQIANMQGPANA